MKKHNLSNYTFSLCISGSDCLKKGITLFVCLFFVQFQTLLADIEHVGTTKIWDEDGQDISIDVPPGTQAGDLYILILHRTDDYLPLKVDGWDRAAECFKTDNADDCAYASTCENWADDYFCQQFNTGSGQDLAQSIFYKPAGSNEPSSYTFDLNSSGGGHPGWIILTTLRGANSNDPVREWAGVGNDGSSDSKFPSVNGETGDMLMLSQSYDDFVSESAFTAPDGMEYWGYVGNSDETGFLYGELLTSSGETGVRTTNGSGSYDNKDALVSLTIKPQEVSTVFASKNKLLSGNLKLCGSKIYYEIPDNNQKISIKLFDAKGKLVNTLVNGPANSGTYFIDLKAPAHENLSMGIYLCRMESTGVTKTIKVIIK